MFRLNSPAFEDGQEMAQKYGKKVTRIVSPPLEWDGAPEGTRSFALSPSSISIRSPEVTSIGWSPT